MDKEKTGYSFGQKYDVIELLTASRKVFTGRCIITGVSLAGDGANADCQIFDDPGGVSNEKIHLESLSGTTFSWHCRRGAVMNNGIYVKVNASTSHVMLTYYPLEKLTHRGY